MESQEERANIVDGQSGPIITTKIKEDSSKDMPPLQNLDQGRQDSTSDSMNPPLDNNRIVKHIMVIGFHHKHGYQVDYCYPPLEVGGPVFSTPAKPISLPACWKTLPLLCLPDGSHNYDSDTIYFTMPDNIDDDDDEKEETNPHLNSNTNSAPADHTQANNEGIKTIFGTACYRQIQADKLLNRTDDMTRIAVQKSVCVLSKKPLFGLIRSKLEMITHAYFEELDFSKVKILKLTYENLNSLLSRDSVKDNATFLGLSARQLVGHFGCNVLVLFKAMLLEKKILFYKSPVRDLCTTIISMCSLFSGLLESGGLDYSTCDLQLSPTLLEALKLMSPTSSKDELYSDCDDQLTRDNNKVFFSPAKEEVVIISETNFNKISNENVTNRSEENLQSTNSEKKRNESQISKGKLALDESTGDYEVITDSEELGCKEEEEEECGSTDGYIIDDPYAAKLCRLKSEECGLPLQIFTRGSFCLPYLSISYLDLLSDARVKSFVIGATNFLFKQRRDMYDIIVDLEENSITINDPNLKKYLSLTTEDLRFMDYLTKHVRLDNNLPKDEFDLISQDITKWVGGDEWIRYHFRLYTLYLLKVSRTMINLDSFNANFVQVWKHTTNNYKIWESTGTAAVLDNLANRHPFSSAAKGINFSDMKLKLSYAVNSSEKGRMINQTLNGIGKWSIWNNIANAATSASATISTAATNAATSITQQSTSTSSKLDSSSKDKDNL